MLPAGGMFLYGMLALLPKILVSYIVGLGIEFAWAQWKGEEIQEGYLYQVFDSINYSCDHTLLGFLVAVAFA